MARMGKFDVRGLKQLQKQAEQALKQAEQMKLEIAQKIADEFLEEVIQRTPDSDNGQLKKNWKAEIQQSGKGYNIVVSNDLQHASMIEYGHKTENGGWKQGYFMLHITENDIKEKMNNIATPVIDKYLGGILK